MRDLASEYILASNSLTLISLRLEAHSCIRALFLLPKPLPCMFTLTCSSVSLITLILMLNILFLAIYIFNSFILNLILKNFNCNLIDGISMLLWLGEYSLIKQFCRHVFNYSVVHLPSRLIIDARLASCLGNHLYTNISQSFLWRHKLWQLHSLCVNTWFRLSN